jgi:two-component system osmolarity sensor histidine kinase EnvZ
MVFKPFRRLENSRSRETGGVGLGLTIARDIVQSHGGEIVLGTPAGGRGLDVRVTVPLLLGAPAA